MRSPRVATVSAQLPVLPYCPVQQSRPRHPAASRATRYDVLSLHPYRAFNYAARKSQQIAANVDPLLTPRPRGSIVHRVAVATIAVDTGPRLMQRAATKYARDRVLSSRPVRPDASPATDRSRSRTPGARPSHTPSLPCQPASQRRAEPTALTVVAVVTPARAAISIAWTDIAPAPSRVVCCGPGRRVNRTNVLYEERQRP
jgi:hypothetical protein